jgi:iron complex outermembrane recepter protein
LTPGVDFTTQNFGGTSKTYIAIRGISSQTGANTVGVYIDDTPIQGRDLLDLFGPAYPQIFDLDRVEILRGPQGTLFGAGSEGGTVRFITPQPSLTQDSGYARAEFADTKNGAPSYEAGAAFGGPIVENVLGFRASAWYRTDGGYVDRVDANTGAVVDPNSNWHEAKVFRLAFALAPVDGLLITPSIYYQDTYTNDTSSYWENLSNPSDGVFQNGKVLAQPTDDQSYLPSLKIEDDFGPVKLTSVSSYFGRDSNGTNDYTNFESSVTTGQPYPTLPGQHAPEFARSSQGIATEELRLQSTDPDSRLTWVAGLFFSKNRQESNRAVEDQYFPQLIFNATGLTLEQLFGAGLYQGKYTFVDRFITHDQQTAAFGELSYKIIDKLTFTAGVRVARTKFDFNEDDYGPVNGPVPTYNQGTESETPVTPKYALSYQVNDNNLLYVSVAKGYRIGGGNGAIPATQCGADLKQLGLTSGPASYTSDTVWSYEIGAKSNAYDGRIRVDASAFHIDWKQIQQEVALACGFNFTGNLGTATSNGFDLALSAEITKNFLVGVALGYTDAKYTETVGTGTSTIVSNGDTLGLTPWTARFSPEYDFTLLGRKVYARGDYIFRSHNDGRPVGQDPAAVATYDPTIPLDPTTHLVNLRAGILLSGLDLSIFVNNAFDSEPALQRYHDIPPSTLYTSTTFRPRTIGVTAAYRF